MKTIVIGEHERPVTSVVFNRDGDLLFSCGKDGFLNCYLVRAKKRFGRYRTGAAAVSSCDVTLDSEYILATSLDMKIFVFEVATGIEVASISEDGPIRFAEWNRKPGHQNKILAARDGFAQKFKPAIMIYERKDGSDKFERILTISDFKAKCRQVHFGPYDLTVLSFHDDGLCMVWDATTGDILREIKMHTGGITDVDMSNDRLIMLTCSVDSTAALWDTVNYNCIMKYKTDRPLNSCSISPLWNDSVSPRLHVLFGGGQMAEQVTTTAASAGRFEALLYHMVFGYHLASVKGHYSPINAVTYMPDGMGMVTGAEEGNVRVVAFDNEYLEKIEA